MAENLKANGAQDLTFGSAVAHNSVMRLALLVIFLGHTTALSAQERRLELLKQTDPAPESFTPAGSKLKAPSGQSEAIRREAAEWVKKRATAQSWRAIGWEFAGEYRGLPADGLEHGLFQVYRMRFKGSPYVGNEPQSELLFYAQENLIVWPPEQWSRTKPAPGQMNAVIQAGLRNN